MADVPEGIRHLDFDPFAEILAEHTTRMRAQLDQFQAAMRQIRETIAKDYGPIFQRLAAQYAELNRDVDRRLRREGLARKRERNRRRQQAGTRRR